MENVKPYNIIIAGVGGQGVFSLTRVIWKLCELAGMKCQGSTFKGGAQKLGSVYSALRIFLDPIETYNHYSTQIPDRDLDVMIGLEPWEVLRYHRYFHTRTKIYMNTTMVPLFLAGQENTANKDPVEMVKQLNLSTSALDYTKSALHLFGTPKMVNYKIGFDAVAAKDLPFQVEDYANVFLELVRVGEPVRRKIRAEFQS